MAQIETRDLVCKLTEAEKVVYRTEVADLGIAHGEIVEALKAKLQEIKVAKQSQGEILDTLKFGQEDGPDKDEHGRAVLVEIDADRREELETENLDLATELEELIEQRAEIHNERKTTKDGIKTRLKALRYGQEERPVKCEWRPNFSEQRSQLWRLDTGEAIESRPLSDEEAQTGFEFERSRPRAMVQCPVCNVSYGATEGKLNDHKLGSSYCIGGGLTTQQAASMAGRLADYEKLPDAGTLELIRQEVVAASYGEGRDGIRTFAQIAQERETDAGEGYGQGDGAIDDSEADPVTGNAVDGDGCMWADEAETGMEDGLKIVEQPDDDHVAWDAASALPGYLEQLKLGYVSDIRPGDVDNLLELAGKHAHDLVAYLLAQPADLKPTTKRALKAL